MENADIFRLIQIFPPLQKILKCQFQSWYSIIQSALVYAGWLVLGTEALSSDIIMKGYGNSDPNVYGSCRSLQFGRPYVKT